MWVAMFSQSGSEIVNIAKHLDRVPDVILTNNADTSTWNPWLDNVNTTIIVGKHSELVSILSNMQNVDLITLHGYLRILPPEIVEKFDVVNGHPGDIVKYPELKGFNPQAKAIELGLPSTGVVIHKAVAEVDAGEIVKRGFCAIDSDMTTEQLIYNLKELQLTLWCNYLAERFDI